MTNEKPHVYDKASFDAGYVMGQRSMEAKHRTVAERLGKLKLTGGGYENLSAICGCIYPDAFGWTRGVCEALRDELVWLFGGVREMGKTTTYDELSNERHTAICRLRRFEPMIGERPTDEASKLIQCITGNDYSRVACVNDLEETRDRLIHLLGGDQPTLGDLWGMWVEKDYESAESVEIQQESTEKGTEDAPVAPISITSEHREYADGYCYRGHFEAFKGTACPMPCDNPAETLEDAIYYVSLGTDLDANGTASNDDGTCPNSVPIVSITDELRKFAETFRYEWYDEKDGSVCYTTSDFPPTIDSVNGADYINAIADRIDAKHAELRRKLEAVKGIVDGS